MASTWSGWQRDFLNTAGIIVTTPNMNFLTDWHNHAPSSCNFNPIDLSTSVGDSSRCGDTVAGFGRTQRYTKHAEARSAFRIQIDTAWVRPLKQALNSGNPFQIGDRSQVVSVLRQWGSPQFADWYANAPSGGGGGGGGTGTKAPGFHHSWHSLRRTTNYTWPQTVRHVAKLNKAAWRALGRTHKVKG